MRPLLCALALYAPAFAQWGRDLDPGMARQMLDAVEPDLVRIVRAAPADRPALVEACVAKHGAERIEALKRFRNPELLDLFLALADHPDWRVQHRALTVLESYGGAAALDKALALLRHPNRRLREKAAIACILLWDGRPPPPALREIAAEEDLHVRRSFEALARRAGGALPVTVAKEPKETLANGLVVVPYATAAEGDGEAAPDGGGRPPPVERWVHPLLGYGEEEVPDARLLGACLDGAGVYAAAEGVVREAGARVVVGHDGATTSYAGAGRAVFVAPGERVVHGQLLAAIELGFSRGAPAQLRFGVDGNDAARFLAFWTKRTQPLLPRLRPLDGALAGPVKHAETRRYGDAHAAALRVRDRAEPGSERHVDAVYLLGLLERVPGAGLARARWLREEGYPGDAVKELDDAARACRGVPGGEGLKAELDAWEEDPLFRKALKGEGRIEAARRTSGRDRERTRAAWEKLLGEYGDTCLRPRIEAELK